MNEDSTVVRLRQPEDDRRSVDGGLALGGSAPAGPSDRGGSRGLPGRDGRSTARRWAGPRSSGTAMAPNAPVQTGIGPVGVRRVKVRDRAPAESGERVRFTSADPTPMGTADAKPGCVAADPLSARHLDGRLPRGARRPAGQGGAEPVAVGDRPAEGRLAGRLRALAEARSVGAALRLHLGRRRLPAGAAGAPGRVHAGADRRHARGQEGAGRLPGRHARERAELAGAAGRPQGARSDHRARACHRRRRARLLEGARGGVADHPAPALHRAQDRQRARQAAQVRPAGRQGRSTRGLDGPGPYDGRSGNRELCREVWGQIREGGHLPGQGSRRAA